MQPPLNPYFYYVCDYLMPLPALGKHSLVIAATVGVPVSGAIVTQRLTRPPRSGRACNYHPRTGITPQQPLSLEYLPPAFCPCTIRLVASNLSTVWNADREQFK